MSKSEVVYEDANMETIDDLADMIERKRAERMVNDYKTVMGTVQGRRVLWDILGRAGLYHQSYMGNDKVNDMLVNEGRRSLGLQVLELITAIDENVFIKMQTEAIRDQLNKLPKESD